MSYGNYSVEDDKRTIAFWILGGGLLASIVLLSPFFFIFALAVTCAITRGLENIDAKRPVYMPGKHHRHFQDSVERAVSSKPYSGVYRRRIKKSRYY